ncbi:hypothetical protein M409DRAFT_30047 [Zasmidium cellare ATCC 36951]|uniref:ASST-domain-containing protein n=1 Tax=Zasmidium cellare ATCC 36951 TaxID=1080233 RepID=A0A6A6C0U9_ZASCE|nr:uncharacterized protein M409DRAFT_30047 [Zasmidium cellare ATCC 36951]KAF2159429.1 hypothetical protein M409DRAFT_30047 [Zasmidium cellare ATCC 36951]
MFTFFAGLATLAYFILWIVHIEAVQHLNDKKWPVQTFESEPGFHPPVLEITAPEQASKDGYLFFAPGGPQASQTAPVIMTNNGELIWNGPPGLFAFNFGVQTYKGEDVLVFWNGSRFPEPKGRGHGNVYLWNRHYEQIANVSLAGEFVEFNGESYPSNIDLHEHYITENGTLLVLAYNVTQADLRSVGGLQEGWVVEGQVYEIDIETNEVLFAWRSLEHLDKLPFTSSVYPLGSEGYDGRTRENAWGYFHHNSVTPFREGYIISSRYFCSAIAISRTSGEVLWVLQGRDGGDSHLQGENGSTSFCYQHDIRVLEEKVDQEGDLTQLTLSMHDNANSPIDKNKIPTSGKIFSLDFSTNLATQTHRYLNTSGLVYGTAQGSHQRLTNGNIFEGAGYIPIMEEFSPEGTPLCRWIFGTPLRTTEGGFLSPEPESVVLSYRAYKQPWVGCPRTKPAVVLNASNGTEGMTAYISWNGATEVEKWEVWGRREGKKGRVMKVVEKSGFETVVEVGRVEVVWVRALLRKGAPRGCGGGVWSERVRVKDDEGVDKRKGGIWW